MAEDLGLIYISRDSHVIDSDKGIQPTRKDESNKQHSYRTRRASSNEEYHSPSTGAWKNLYINLG